MHRSQLTKLFSGLLALCLLITYIPFSAVAEEVPVQSNEPAPAALTNGVSWNMNEVVTVASVTMTVGTTRTVSSLGLTPRAYQDGVLSTSFSWSSTSSLVTINTYGSIHANAEGIAFLTGQSRVYGYGCGLLTLILFIVDADGVDATMVDAVGDNISSDTAFISIHLSLDDMGYINRRVHDANSESSMTSNLFVSYIASSSILFFRGHGEANSITLRTENDVSTYLRTSNLSILPSDAFENCD